jgi:hypothetical protein
MRLRNCALWLASFVFVVLLSAQPARAAGQYFENFNTGLANGWTSTDTWLVNSSHFYGNTEESHFLENVVAVYNNDSWSTDYTLRAMAFSTDGNAGDTTKWGNRVGLVFNYQSPGNYHRVLVNMLGEVRLEKVTNGTVSSSLVSPIAAQQIDDEIWFGIEIVVKGSQVSVKVKDTQVFTNANVTGLAAGKIGLISQYNLALFDDVSVTPMANALFRTSFESSTTIVPPSSCNSGTCISQMTGTDSVTGFVWPARFWDLERGVMQAITANTDVDSNASLLTNHIRDEIQSVTGPAGTTTKVLYQAILTGASGYSSTPQNPHYIYKSGASAAQQSDLYFRYWLKLGASSGLGSWRTLLQWKTQNDFRLNLNTTTAGRGVNSECNAKPDGSAYWHVWADNEPSGGSTTFWEKCDKTHAIPIGQWFKVEFFSHRGTPGGTDGRVWLAINGQTYVDVSGQQMWGAHADVDAGKINRIMAPQMYTNANPANGRIEQWVDDLEIWDNFPPDASPH